ncbi:MAG: Gfo/Idh/MocA family oxidoreductase [Cyclobacteriaceae bacterium]|nr:Gfo/Idh/MocA family oxidoreductase [Cyclobacteriaceae bacterium]UYN88122.1 MAG: Gfo/Idh/MocA family oxidoreductase [Cyclobacteriaceae bacterium]
MHSRRKFIKHVLATSAGMYASRYAFANIIIPQTKAKLGVALVGLGYYSTDLLAPALQLTQHCELKGIVTGTPEKAEQWKKKYNLADKNIYNYQNFESLANNQDIDIIYVVLPPSMHAEYTIRAARIGKHVWCEKPMAMTVTECQQMIDACKQNKVKLSIGYRMQHEPNTQQIIKYRKNLTYGKVLKADAAAGYFDGRTNHWKQIKKMGGGATYDMGVYPINAIRYSTGLEPIAVTANQSTERPHIYTEVDETMVFDLEFPGSVIAHGETSLGKNINNLLVTCEKGWYKLSPFQSYSDINGVTSDGKKLNASIPNQQAKQMDDDALAIKQGKAMLVPGEEGLKDIRVVEAIYKSVAEKKRVII